MALVILIVALVFFGIGRMTKETKTPEVGESQSQGKQEEKKIIPEDKTFNMVAIRRYNVS